MTDTTEVETVGRFDWLGETVVENIYEEMYPMVVSDEWVTFPLEDQISLADNLKLAYEALGILRQKFDAVIYKGHETGRIDKSVLPVRAAPDYQNGKPGKSAPSAAEVLKRKLKNR